MWRIQKVAEKGKSSGGVVMSPYGIAEDPNAEILAPGMSTSKEYGAVGVARYGHYLYWGYSGTPSQMTEDGKKFFLNSLVYLKQANQKKTIKKIDLNVMYVGKPETERAKDFVKLLSDNFTKVEVLTQEDFKEEKVTKSDVVIMDYVRPRRVRTAGGVSQPREPVLQLPEDYSKPTIVFSSFGATETRKWLKPTSFYT